MTTAFRDEDGVALAMHEQMMLHIKALDPDASIAFSSFTKKWYVIASISISDGRALTGITEHHDSPQKAIAAYFEHLRTIDLDHTIATQRGGERHHWRWNGVAFALDAYAAVIFQQQEPQQEST